MGIPLFTNNAYTALAASIVPTDTVIQVTAGTGGLFPNPTGGNYFYLTLISLTNNEQMEIVQCTARVGDVLTVVRGAEGTTPQAFSISDNVQLRITAAGLEALITPPTTTLPATAITSTPVGIVTATNVQGAINQLASVSPTTPTAAQVTYNEGATGAVTTTVQAKLQESISVKDFGAVGNGSADDTTAIQAAINSLSSTGGTVYFPAGTYKVSSTLNITHDNITLAGAGKGATTLSTYIASNDIISFSGVARGGVQDMSITASTSQVAGAGIHFTNCDNVRATNILVGYGLYTGIAFDGGGSEFENYVDNFEISTCTFGILIGAAGAQPQDIFISTGVIGSCSNSGIFIYQGSGIYVDTVDIISSNKGITTYPGSSQNVSNCFFDTVLCDTCTTTGWSFFSNGGRIEQVNMINCWGSTCTNHGMELAAQCNAFSITNFRAINNKQNGIYLQGATNIGLVNCQVMSNSMQGSALYNGLAIDGTCSDITVIGGKYGSGWEGAGYNYQAYGILVAAGTINHYAIIGADVNGNVTGGIQDLGTGTDKYVQLNPGMPGGSGSGVTSVGLSAGSTRLAVSGSPIVSSGTFALSTTDGFPLVTQAYSGSAAGNIATFNNSGGTQIADCGIHVGSGYIQPPSGMTLGTLANPWGTTYSTTYNLSQYNSIYNSGGNMHLSVSSTGANDVMVLSPSDVTVSGTYPLKLGGNLVWNSYTVAAPTGSTSTFLRNDGTWATPGTGLLSSNNTWSGTNIFQPTSGINVGGSTTSNSMLIGFNGAAINFYNSYTGNSYNSLYYSATGTALANQAYYLAFNNAGSFANEYIFAGDGTAQKTGGGSWASISDARLKSNVAPLTGSLDKIAALNPVTYSWNIDTTEPTVGFIAQEVQTVIPNAVKGHAPNETEAKFITDETLSIGWQNDMTAYLVGAIKELKAVVDAQAVEISELKAKVGV